MKIYINEILVMTAVTLAIVSEYCLVPRPGARIWVCGMILNQLPAPLKLDPATNQRPLVPLVGFTQQHLFL